MDITMPQLGETVTEGTITKWLKQVGDQIAPDDLLFEVSTDKVDSEVPSPSGGYLAEILVPEGETVPVGTKLAVLTDSPAAGNGGTAAPAPTPAAEAPAAPAPAPGAEAVAPAPVEAPAPAAEQPAPAPPPAAEQPAPAPPPAAPAPAPAPAAEQPLPPRPDGVVLSPVVRRLIDENNLDPAQITGTGEGGRITRNDVLGVIDRQGGGQPAAAPAAAPAATAAPPASAPAAPAAPAAQPAVPASEREEIIPFDNIRRRTAEHMVRSKQTSPHVLTAMEVDFERVERVRTANKEEWRAREGFALTYLPFIARALVDAISDFPNVNATIDGDNLVVHHYINLGIAVDLDFKGLLVPVVKAADGKRLRQLARDIRDLAERARSRKLTPDDVVGGTYTITNPGPFGTLISAPVINQPQVAILSTEGVKKRPVVVESDDGDSIAIHHVGIVAQSFDHRAIDGAYSAAFLRRLKEIIETRDWEAELA